MTCAEEGCKSYEVIKDEGHAKILQCFVCGRTYHKFWHQDLQTMDLLNGGYIREKELAKWNNKFMRVVE